MEWIEYTPNTRYLGDWNEEIYSQGGKSQYQQQQRFDANELGGLPSLPENESQSDITLLNNTSHNTPVFTNLKICNRQPPSYKDNNAYIGCVLQEQTIPDYDRVMMPLANSNVTDAASVKDEQVDSTIIGDIFQQCDEKNDNSQVLNLKIQTSAETSRSANNSDGTQMSDTSYTPKGQDGIQQSKMAEMPRNSYGTYHAAESYGAGVSHLDSGFPSKVPALLPSFPSTPCLPNHLSHGVNSFKFFPLQSQNNEQRLAQDGSDQVTSSNDHVGGLSENQSTTSLGNMSTNNTARPPKNCTQNTCNAAQNTDVQHYIYAQTQTATSRRLRTASILIKFDEVNPYPCEQPFIDGLTHHHSPFNQGFNSGYQQQLAGGDFANVNYHSKPSSFSFHPPALPSENQTAAPPMTVGDGGSFQCVTNSTNFPASARSTSVESRSVNHPKTSNDFVKYETEAGNANACPAYPQTTPPSYAASQARFGHGQQPFFTGHSSIFRGQIPGDTIGSWQQNETYKMGPNGMNWQGSFSEPIYRTFTKIEAMDWMNGMGAGPQDLTSRTSGCGIGFGNTMTIPSHTAANEIPQIPLEIRELSESDVTTKKSGKQKKTQRNRKFKCTYPNCTKSYCKQAQLETHLRKHKGERPYRCEWEGCESCFQRSDQLKRHQRRHTGERPYRCILCDKCFARSDHLKTHNKTHEDKPHFCQWMHCKKKFAQFEELSRHYQTHKSKERTHLPGAEVPAMIV